MSVSAESQRAIVEWLATTRTGVSSETIAFWVGFGIRRSFASHPYDPDDFDRCLQLLDAVPELRSQLLVMRGISDAWARLVNRWNEVETMHLAEVGLGWTKARHAPQTYALMKLILKEPTA